MAARIALTYLSIVLAVGCGGNSITEPNPVSKQVVQTTVPPVPEPPPTTPPVPVPTPGPTTPPPGATVDYYDAEVATVFWQGTPLFGNRFAVEVWRERGELWLHQTRLWIVQRDENSVIATDRNPDGTGGAHTLTATLNLRTRQWSFNGLVGSGGGPLTPRESQ